MVLYFARKGFTFHLFRYNTHACIFVQLVTCNTWSLLDACWQSLNPKITTNIIIKISHKACYLGRFCFISMSYTISVGFHYAYNNSRFWPIFFQWKSGILSQRADQPTNIPHGSTGLKTWPTSQLRARPAIWKRVLIGHPPHWAGWPAEHDVRLMIDWWTPSGSDVFSDE